MSISKRNSCRACVAALVIVAGAILLLREPVKVALSASGPPVLNHTLPGDVATGANANDIDDFSWKSFVAINWPANGHGSIGAKSDDVAVWQFWKQDADILVPNGQTPITWKTPSLIPAICPSGAPAGTRILTHITKGGLLGTFTTPGNGPLIDQNKTYVRFEILVNEDMYDFILANQLYSVTGQQNYNPTGIVVFPSGVIGGPPGAVMLKLAWKIMGAGDDPKRFHTAMAYIYDPSATPTCVLTQVGMVGMHISHKTVNAPQWVWSTFEHVDNAPLLGSSLAAHYNFNNGQPASSKVGCDKAQVCNVVPKGAWNPNSGTDNPVEVVRLNDLTNTAKHNNALYQAALKAVNRASVFANYQLIGTQFPSDITSTSSQAGFPLPVFLANTTMETFLQGHTAGVSSSCGGCHAQASMSDGRASDFSYILQRVGMQ